MKFLNLTFLKVSEYKTTTIMRGLVPSFMLILHTVLLIKTLLRRAREGLVLMADYLFTKDTSDPNQLSYHCQKLYFNLNLQSRIPGCSHSEKILIHLKVPEGSEYLPVCCSNLGHGLEKQNIQDFYKHPKLQDHLWQVSESQQTSTNGTEKSCTFVTIEPISSLLLTKEIKLSLDHQYLKIHHFPKNTINNQGHHKKE